MIYPLQMTKSRKIAVAITIPAIMLLAFFVYFNKGQSNLTLVKPTVIRPALTEITGWKTYQNEKYHFALQYPTEWEPLEQDHTKFSDGMERVLFANRYPQFNSLSTICFAPQTRTEFYCEVEVYISQDVTKFASGKNDFLGLPVVGTPMLVGGITAKSYAEG